jgi:hypothetical protein
MSAEATFCSLHPKYFVRICARSLVGLANTIFALSDLAGRALRPAGKKAAALNLCGRVIGKCGKAEPQHEIIIQALGIL